MSQLTREQFKKYLDEYPLSDDSFKYQELLTHDTAQRTEIVRLSSEVERLKAEMGYHEAKDVIEQLSSQVTDLTQQLEQTKSTMASDYEMDMNEQLRKNRDLTQQLAAAQVCQDEVARLCQFTEAQPLTKQSFILQTITTAQARVRELEQELVAYREKGLTEEILRRQDGFLKLGTGCTVVRSDDYAQLTTDLATCREALTKLSTLGGGRSEGNCIAQEALRAQAALGERTT